MSIFYGLATRALHFFLKKVTRKGHFPRPAETDPYVHVEILKHQDWQGCKHCHHFTRRQKIVRKRLGDCQNKEPCPSPQSPPSRPLSRWITFTQFRIHSHKDPADVDSYWLTGESSDVRYILSH